MESKESYFNEGNRPIYYDLDNLSELRRDISITSHVIAKFFVLKPILGDGNCLFNSISYVLKNKYKLSDETPTKLRKELYDFYQSDDYKRIKEGIVNNEFEGRFHISTHPAAGDAEYDYVEDHNGIYYRHNDFRGIYNTLSEIGYRQDEYMMSHRYRRIAHTENIKNNRVFGSNGDTIAFCYLLGINIILITEDRENKHYHHVMPFIINDKTDDAIYLQLIGEVHYQILMPRNEPFDRLDGLSSPPTLSKYTRKSKSLKDNNQTRKKSPPRNNPVTQQDLEESMNLLEKLLAKQQKLQESIKGYEQLLVELNDTSDIEQVINEQVINAIEKQRENLDKIENKINDKLNNLYEIHKKLQQPMNELKTLFETHDSLQKSIKEKEKLLHTKHNKAYASQVNKEVTQLTSEMKNIETQIHKIIGTEFSLYVALSELVARFLATIKIW